MRTTKKLLSILLALCMVVSLLPATALAAEGEPVDTWADAVTTQPDGYVIDTASKTLNISTAEGLAWFAKEINSWENKSGDAKVDFAGYTINIKENIDLSAHLWVPIDASTVKLNGVTPQQKIDRDQSYNNRLLAGATINGNNHTISNMVVKTTVRGPRYDSNPGDGQNSYYYAGFIGRTTGDLNIKDLTFANASVDASQEQFVETHGGSSMAVVSGYYSGGTLTLDNVTIDQCFVDGMQKVGGYVGQCGGSVTINKCAVVNSTFRSLYQCAPVIAYAMKNQYNNDDGTDKNERANTLSIQGVKLENNTVNIVKETDNIYQTFGDIVDAYFWQSDEKWSYWLGNQADAVLIAQSRFTRIGNTKNVVADVPLMMVAEVNGYQYATLADAISAAQTGDTVTLLKDVTLEEGTQISGGHKTALVIPAEKQITLDLNGFNLTCSEGGSKDTNYSLLSVEGDLTIQDSTAVSVPAMSGDYNTVTYESGRIQGGYWRTVEVQPGGHLTVKSGHIKSSAGDGIFAYANTEPEGSKNVADIATSITVEGGWIDSWEYGIGVIGRGAALNISDGVVTAGNNAAVGGNGTNNVSSYQGGTVINITGGTLIGHMSDAARNNGSIACGIYHPQAGMLTISGGTIYADRGVGVEMRGGTLNMTGGSVIATGNESGKVGDSKVAANCYGIQIDGDSNYYDYGNCKVNISGNAFVKSDKGVPCVIVTPADGQDKMTITGGHFTSDPSAYVAQDYAALPGTETGYAFTVGTKPNVDVEPAAGDPVVDMSAIPEASKKDAETVAKSVEDKGELAAAANSVLNTVTEEDKAAAEQALQEALSPAEGTNITTYVQTYLDIKPTAYDETSKTFTLDITPMYRVVASTAAKAEDIEVVGETSGTANAVVLEGSETELTTLKTMTISVTLPTGWSAAYVQHKGYEYVATVNSGVATFTNPHGFSEFVFSATPAAAAEVNGERYMDLSDALNAARNGQTVTILKAPDANTNYSMSGDSRTITLKREESGNDFDVTINGTKYTVTTDGVKVTYTAPTYTGPSGYAVKTEVGAHGKLTVSSSYATKGTTVTVTVTPDKGYVLSDLTVTDKNGNALTLTDKGNGKYTFVMPEGAVTVKAAFGPESLPFTDVSLDAYYANAVKWAVDNGVTSGLTDTTFGPNVSCTRAQVVTFLWRAAGSPVVNYAMKFTDVPADAYYAEAVRWAVSKGITAGVTETTFGPEQTVTRAQVVAFLYRQAGSPAVGSKNPFTDVASDVYYADAVKWAVAQKITAGTTDTTFSPNADCTRGQIVTFLYNDMAK